jgi:hypothetical protein
VKKNQAEAKYFHESLLRISIEIEILKFSVESFGVKEILIAKLSLIREEIDKLINVHNHKLK